MRLLVAVALLCAGCGGGGGAERAATTRPPATSTEATEPQDIEEAGATAVDITGDWLSAGADAVWLTNPPSQEIYRLDPRTGETVATIRVPQLPCAASDFGFGALWTLTCKRRGLAKIDPATNKVAAQVPLRVGAADQGGEASVAAGEGAVWVVLHGASVARVDPRSLRVVARIPVRPGAAAIRAGEGAVWVTNPEKSLVQKSIPRATASWPRPVSGRRRASSRPAKAACGR